eukprot:m.271783 g.271783  ORF g.271783 m.271783 type:complete len:417 (-) comp54785_c0_seq17:21-1271(-)
MCEVALPPSAHMWCPRGRDDCQVDESQAVEQRPYCVMCETAQNCLCDSELQDIKDQLHQLYFASWVQGSANDAVFSFEELNAKDAPVNLPDCPLAVHDLRPENCDADELSQRGSSSGAPQMTVKPEGAPEVGDASRHFDKSEEDFDQHLGQESAHGDDDWNAYDLHAVPSLNIARLQGATQVTKNDRQACGRERDYYDDSGWSFVALPTLIDVATRGEDTPSADTDVDSAPDYFSRDQTNAWMFPGVLRNYVFPQHEPELGHELERSREYGPVDDDEEDDESVQEAFEGDPTEMDSAISSASEASPAQLHDEATKDDYEDKNDEEAEDDDESEDEDDENQAEDEDDHEKAYRQLLAILGDIPFQELAHLEDNGEMADDEGEDEHGPVCSLFPSLRLGCSFGRHWRDPERTANELCR